MLRRHVDKIIPFREFRINDESRPNVDVDFHSSTSAVSEQPVSPPNHPSVESSPTVERVPPSNAVPEIVDNSDHIAITNNDNAIPIEDDNVTVTEYCNNRKSTRVRKIPDRYQAGFG